MEVRRVLGVAEDKRSPGRHVLLAVIALVLAGCGRPTPATEDTAPAAQLSHTKADDASPRSVGRPRRAENL
jgi:type IV pilus biogenesis protein CpaD/CtpE